MTILYRIRALVRRGRVAETPRLSVGDLEMDLVTRKVTRAGQPGPMPRFDQDEITRLFA